MNITERIKDILTNEEISFNQNEIKKHNSLYANVFKSIEYHSILHFTNEEYYYLDVEEVNNLNKIADEQGETKAGFFYCFK